jgi:hypothetical protein
MKKLFTLAAVLSVFTSTSAFALSQQFVSPMQPQGEDLFGVAPLPDEVLEKERGGFVAPGGLRIDFTLTSRTLVNGNLERDVALLSNQLSNVQADQLRQVIQIGQNNQFHNVQEVIDNPAVTTIIQNSLDGTVIQNFNILDLNVNNLSQFQASTPIDNAIQDQVTFIR